MKKRFRDYPPNVPRKLIKAFRAAACNTRRLEKEIGVNNYFICKLLNEGIEPTDQTEKGRAARVKLFLKEYKPKPRVKRPPKPHPDPLTSDWWSELRKRATSSMVRRTNDAVIRRRP